MSKKQAKPTKAQAQEAEGSKPRQDAGQQLIAERGLFLKEFGDRKEAAELFDARWDAWVARAGIATNSKHPDAACSIGPTTEGWAVVPLRMTRMMREVVEEEGWEWQDLLAAAEAITVEQYNEECSDTVAAEWFDSVVRLERIASAAINQSSADQRNILEDIAVSLSKMTYAARPSRSRVASNETTAPVNRAAAVQDATLRADI